MELNRHKRQCGMNDTLVGSIVGVGEPGLKIRRNIFHGEAMVLGCDKAAGTALHDAGLVLSAMAKLHFIRVATGGQGQNLIAHADSRHLHRYLTGNGRSAHGYANTLFI